MQTPSKSKTDLQLQQDVLSALSSDPAVDAALVGVEVAGGIVTLTGTADCWAKKHAAEQAAHRVTGVRDLANDIAVRPYWAPVTDAELAAAVRNALAADPSLPADRIQTTVDEGIVTLEGVVDYTAQRMAAAQTIHNLAGVRGVFNHVLVQPPSSVAPDAVRAAITAAIERHAARGANKIELDIEGGHVTLKGTVKAAGERQAIVGAASATPGVEMVVDQLRVG